MLLRLFAKYICLIKTNIPFERKMKLQEIEKSKIGLLCIGKYLQ